MTTDRGVTFHVSVTTDLGKWYCGGKNWATTDCVITEACVTTERTVANDCGVTTEVNVTTD